MIKDNRTIIEITNANIKVLQINIQRGNPVLANFEIYETKNRTEQQLIGLLTNANIKTKNTILVIPKRNVILKQFSMPSQDEKEIRKMLAIKILQQVPFTQDEIVFDHSIIEKSADGYSKVLAAISPLEQISTNRRILGKAGLVITNVLISSFGIAGWFRHLLPQEKGPVGVLNLDYDSVELCFCNQGKFLFSRNFNFGLNDLNEKNIADILHQIELTLKAYQTEFPAQKIGKIFIASDVFQIQALKNGITDRFNIPTEGIKPSEKISCELQVLSLIKNNPMVSIIGAWGFVLTGTDHQIDLMPHSTEPSENNKLSTQNFLRFFLSTGILLILLVAVLSLGTYQKYLYLAQLENDLSAVQNKSNDEQQKLDDIRKIKALDIHPLPMADILRDIYKAAPAGLYFHHLSMSPALALRIEGLSPSQIVLNDFQKKLSQIPWFKSVTMEGAIIKQINNETFLEFRILCQTSSFGESKVQ